MAQICQIRVREHLSDAGKNGSMGCPLGTYRTACHSSEGPSPRIASSRSGHGSRQPRPGFFARGCRHWHPSDVAFYWAGCPSRG